MKLRWIGPLLGGFLFALGLGVSGMLEPDKIIGFLDIFGDWDPSLLFVMLGAISVHMASYSLIKRRPTPLFEKRFYLPTKRELDRPLILGSLIFGVGWGVSGLCPGPGLVALTSLNSYAFLFVTSMLGGMLISKRLSAP